MRSQKNMHQPRNEKGMKKNIIIYWIPPLALMILIFYLSSRESLSVSDKYFFNFLFFKSLHVIEYGLLFLLLLRALHKTTHYSLRKSLFIAFLISFFYAISDEVHQTFVPTREGRPRDVFIDTIGIASVFLVIKSYKKKALDMIHKKYIIFG